LISCGHAVSEVAILASCSAYRVTLHVKVKGIGVGNLDIVNVVERITAGLQVAVGDECHLQVVYQ